MIRTVTMYVCALIAWLLSGCRLPERELVLVAEVSPPERRRAAQRAEIRQHWGSHVD